MKNFNFSSMFKQKKQKPMFNFPKNLMTDTFNTRMFSPRKDFDKDGVRNLLDCNPFDRKMQDFTPTPRRDQYSDMTAAQKFGGRNLARLKQIGLGRDRRVYQLDKDKVLKVARNPGGVTQNYPESDLDNYIDQVKHYETGKDYVVMELIPPITSKKAKLKLKDLKKAADESDAFGTSTNPDTRRANFFNSPAFERSGIDTGVRDFPVNPRELAAKRQLGEKDGDLVLVDAGTLLRASELNKFRDAKVRRDAGDIGFQREDVDEGLTDWHNIKLERQKYRTKGKEYPEGYDKHAPAPYVLQDLPEKTQYPVGIDIGTSDYGRYLKEQEKPEALAYMEEPQQRRKMGKKGGWIGGFTNVFRKAPVQSDLLYPDEEKQEEKFVKSENLKGVAKGIHPIMKGLYYKRLSEDEDEDRFMDKEERKAIWQQTKKYDRPRYKESKEKEIKEIEEVPDEELEVKEPVGIAVPDSYYEDDIDDDFIEELEEEEDERR